MRALRIVGIALTPIAMTIMAGQLANRLGQSTALGVLAGLSFLAYGGHTERSKWIVGLFMAAIDRHMSRKEAAIIMGIQPSQLSRWDSGEEQASLNKLALLPNNVIRDAYTPFLQDIGDVVAPSGRLASVTTAMLKLAAAMEASPSAMPSRQEVKPKIA